MKLTEEKSVKIYAKERTWSGGSFTVYSMGVSSKDKDSNWVNGFLDCEFKKGVNVANKSKIKINNAFPVVRKSGEKTFVKWFITDFEVIEEGEVSQPQNDDFMNIPDSDLEELPFK